DEGLPFDMTMVPGVFGPPTAYADSHSFVLPFQSSPDPERRRAVHAMVAHVLKHSLVWADAGHIPAYTPVVEDPAYQELEPQSHYADAIDHLVYDPPAWFTGSGSDFSTYFGNAMQNVWARRTDPLEGWNAFVARIDDLLATPSPRCSPAPRRARSMTTTDGPAPPSGAARPTADGGSSELRRRRRRADNLRGWLYCLPFLAAFVLFLIWPTIYGFWMSLTGVSLAGTKTGFVGLEN